MFDPKQFRAQWYMSAKNDSFIIYEPVMFAGVDIPQDSITFLLEAGLPESAAPFLSMYKPKQRPLPTIAESWKLSADFSRYRELGFDGEGSPICIEEGSGKIMLLDHDMKFAPMLVNSTIMSFVAFLLAYRKLVHQTNAVKGRGAFLNGNIPDKFKQELAEELQRIDSEAVQPGSFWHQELVCLDER